MFKTFSVQFFTSFIKLIPKHFITFDTKRIVFLIFRQFFTFFFVLQCLQIHHKSQTVYLLLLIVICFKKERKSYKYNECKELERDAGIKFTKKQVRYFPLSFFNLFYMMKFLLFSELSCFRIKYIVNYIFYCCCKKLSQIR